MAVFTNKSRDEIDFTDSTAPVINDYPRPYIDQKTTTLDGAIRKIVEEFYKKDIVSGITEFPAQILRVEQRRDRFEPSYLDNLGRDINRELSRRYKVKVVLVDDLKETPKTFDETPEDRQLIDTYPDFIYIPYSFGNNEPMNVGDFVMITYGNLLSRQDGRIIYKISGASHVQGSVGRPTKQDAPKKDKQEAKRVFKEQPPAKSSAPPVPVEAPPEVKTEPPPPPPPPPPAQPTDDLKRTLIDTGFINDKQKVRENRKKENADIEKYNAEVFPSVLEAYAKEKKEIEAFNAGKPKEKQQKLPKQPELKKIKAELGDTFEEFREKWYKAFKRGKINLYKYNKDRTTRNYPEKQELLLDFKDAKNKRYKRAVYPRDEDGYKDSLYVRAFLDIIALHESDINFGWDLLFIGKSRAHPEDIKINKFTDYSQHPQRPSFSDNNEFYETASTAAGRYQFVWNTWKNYQFTDRDPNTLKTPNPLYQDFLPKTQDRAAADAVLGRLRVGIATKQFSDKQKFGEILKNALEKNDTATFVKIFALTKKESGKDTSLGEEWTSLPKKAIEGAAGSQEKTKLEYLGTNTDLIPRGKKFAYLPEIFMQKLKLMVEDQQRLENEEETKYNDKQQITNLALEAYVQLLPPEPKKDAAPKTGALVDKRILIVGDSLTEIVNKEGKITNAPNFGFWLKKFIEAEAGNLDVTALAGYSALNFTNPEKLGGKQFKKFSDNSKNNKYDIMILGLGTNDVAGAAVLTQPQITKAAENIKKLFEGVVSDKKIYVSPPNMNAEKAKAKGMAINNDNISSLINKIKETFSGIEIIDSRNTITENNSNDGIHIFGEQAYNWAKEVYKVSTGLETKVNFDSSKTKTPSTPPAFAGATTDSGKPGTASAAAAGTKPKGGRDKPGKK